MGHKITDKQDCEAVSFIKTYIKRLRLLKVNRELLVFSAFLGISVLFWLLQAFQEDTTLKVEHKLRITNVPENIYIVSKIPEKIGVTISGRGYDVLVYALNNENKEITVNYKDLKCDSTLANIDNTLWKRIFSNKLSNNIHYISAPPISFAISHTLKDEKD